MFLHVSIIFDISLPPSTKDLFLLYAVCWDEIKLGKTDFSFSLRAFDNIFM